MHYLSLNPELRQLAMQSSILVLLLCGASAQAFNSTSIRADARCGPNYPADDGNPGECDPYADWSCCSSYGWCGSSDAHCNCDDCIDYSQIAPPAVLWREDLRCGADYPLEDGNPSECDPNGGNPCCSSYAWCGNTDDHCACSECVDYREEVAPQSTPKKWRDDARCGADFPLDDGSPAECWPESAYHCCSPYGWCGMTDAHCDCPECINYGAP